MPEEIESIDIAIIGGGPAGLAAAESLNAAGQDCVLFEAMPTVGRKFLMAGKSGLNLTKNEDDARFLARISGDGGRLAPMLEAMGPKEVMQWAEALGEDIFTGSSGRVFPKAMKASPVLRKWVGKLEKTEIRRRWRWSGFRHDAMVFETPEGTRLVRARKTLLALGGKSWPRLGSDAAWVPWLAHPGVEITPFQPSNVGVVHAWPQDIIENFSGAPLKNVRFTCRHQAARGDAIITKYGIEGGAVYALSPTLRQSLAHRGEATLMLDLLPARNESWIRERLERPRGKSSISNHWRKCLNISGIKTRLLREYVEKDASPETIARRVKALPLLISDLRPIAEAISSAGGVSWSSLNDDLSLKALPDVFCAGEMLDWDAPTGGYLITACLATGKHAAKGMLAAG